MQNQPKTVFLVLALAFVGSIVIYATLATVMPGVPDNPSTAAQTRPFLIGLAAVSIVGSVLFLKYRLDSLADARRSAESNGQIQTSLLIALAIAEACAVFGLAGRFLGAPASEALIYMGVSALVMIVYIIPAGLSALSK